MVCVSKPNGKIRMCMDPRDLNLAIKREHYHMKTIEDVLADIPPEEAKYVTKLDVTCGFWQIRLDEDSAKLCTFNTSFGRLIFLDFHMA